MAQVALHFYDSCSSSVNLPSLASTVVIPSALKHATLPGLVRPKFVSISMIPKDAGSTHPPTPVTEYSNPVLATRRTHLASDLQWYPRRLRAAHLRARIFMGVQWWFHYLGQRGCQQLAVYTLLQPRRRRLRVEVVHRERRVGVRQLSHRVRDGC